MPTAVPEPPDPSGWVSAADAAKTLGLAEAYVAQGTSSGRFPMVKHRGESWMRQNDLDRLLEQRAEEGRLWVSRKEVAALAGCSTPTVDRAIAQGAISVRDRPRPTAKRSLERESAERWAAQWRAKRAIERSRVRSEAGPSSRPPDDEYVWLDTSTAALIVGVTENLVAGHGGEFSCACNAVRSPLVVATGSRRGFRRRSSCILFEAMSRSGRLWVTSRVWVMPR